MKFPYYKQLDTMDCGPSCLRMVAKYYGKSHSLQSLRNLSGMGKEGVSMLDLSEASGQIGLISRGVKMDFKTLTKEIKLPAILHWNQNHFVVLPPQSFKGNFIKLADPARGLLRLSVKDFKTQWILSNQDGDKSGFVLLLEPSPPFYDLKENTGNRLGWAKLLSYFIIYKKYFLQIILGLAIGSTIQLVLPFLAQSIVDIGIDNKNQNFITTILIAQFVLIMSRTLVDFIRNRFLLFASSHINLAILSAFWMKMIKLPLSYFDTKKSGDILQRINDHKRIEQFLTGTTLNTIFSLFNFLIFSIVLYVYRFQVFIIFSIGSLLYVFWIRIFLQYRKNLDYERFSIAARENSATVQLIYGMQEIKLNNAGTLKRWQWERIQTSMLRINFKGLSLSQYQQSGAVLLNEGKNILITFFVAKAVIDGNMTLGAMVAVQYIIGQLTGPIDQLVSFVQQAQDARISLERLNEIHTLEDEEPENRHFEKLLPQNKSVSLENVSFKYPGAGADLVLHKINLDIPEGKVTAIVGMSGSGKTTLLKLLLRYYETYSGEIKIGKPNSISNLKNISHEFWRDQCGSVMQDGYIFNDSIASNIAVNSENIDDSKLADCCRIANILDFIDSLPLKFDTLIGHDGVGISQGQKQRILIARAIYKNPHYMFFDEATNALDANNEKMILENLTRFFQGRTVVVVAHRLSTVKNADKIIVLRNGEIVEQGTHQELSEKRGHYFQLVKNQLELGN